MIVVRDRTTRGRTRARWLLDAERRAEILLMDAE